MKEGVRGVGKVESGVSIQQHTLNLMPLWVLKVTLKPMHAVISVKPRSV